MKEYRERLVSIPSRTEIKKIVIVPAKLILINKDAAQDAKIIRLVQQPEEDLEFPVFF